MAYTVYMHTCPNGKKYVGITRRAVKRRWGTNGQCYKEHNKHFYDAVQKYGWENITHEIILENATKDEAERIEIFLIATYDTTNREKGYNHASGGCVNKEWKMPDSFIEAHGKCVDKYDLNGTFLGSFPSTAAAARSCGVINGSQITQCCNGKLKKAKGYIFRWHGEDFSKYSTGRLSNEKRAVKQIDLNGNLIAIYESCAEAERKTGIPNTNIIKVCKGEGGRKQAGGYCWQYEEVGE